MPRRVPPPPQDDPAAPIEPAPTLPSGLVLEVPSGFYPAELCSLMIALCPPNSAHFPKKSPVIAASPAKRVFLARAPTICARASRARQDWYARNAARTPFPAIFSSSRTPREHASKLSSGTEAVCALAAKDWKNLTKMSAPQRLFSNFNQPNPPHSRRPAHWTLRK